jgi:hypothetical protein
MAQTLKIALPSACNGCELCVLAAQQQLEKVGLDGALIRVFREDPTTFKVVLDPQVSKLDVSAIQKICPKKVFALEEKTEDALFN